MPETSESDASKIHNLFFKGIVISAAVCLLSVFYHNTQESYEYLQSPLGQVWFVITIVTVLTSAIVELYKVDLKEGLYYYCYLIGTFISYEIGFGLLLLIFWNDLFDLTKIRKNDYHLAFWIHGFILISYSFMNTINHVMLIYKPVQVSEENQFKRTLKMRWRLGLVYFVLCTLLTIFKKNHAESQSIINLKDITASQFGLMCNVFFITTPSFCGGERKFCQSKNEMIFKFIAILFGTSFQIIITPVAEGFIIVKEMLLFSCIIFARDVCLKLRYDPKTFGLLGSEGDLAENRDNREDAPLNLEENRH